MFRAPGDAPLSSATGFGAFPCTGCVPDSINGATTVRQLYDMANDTTGRGGVEGGKGRGKGGVG